MKGGVEHRVPLSPRAVANVREMMKTDEGDYILPGQRDGNPLSNMALLQVLQIRRGDLFEKYRNLMEEWAKFCDIVKSSRANVTSIRKA